MSHRAAHRILAEELRLDRIDAGLPADPSHRERKPRPDFAYYCTFCRTGFRQPWQYRIHAALNGCQQAAL